jgi:uncharacterized protein YjaZ
MIIIGLDDFKRYINLSEQKGKWQVWREYYFPKYEEVFSAMLKYLYRSDIDSLQDAVESLNFEQALKTAHSFFQDRGLLWTEKLLDKSAELCPFEQDYDQYFLIGLGHVDGTSLPGEKPFLYVGLERYESLERMQYLVPHEYYHMVRLWTIGQGVLREDITFGEIVIEEGLATVFSSLVATGSAQVDEKSLLMPEGDLKFCISREAVLVEEIVSCWEQSLTPKLLEAYLVGSYAWRNGRPSRIGYFVGACVIEFLLTQGYTLNDLIKLSADEIMGRYSKMRQEAG